jgi:hypothetical protein
MHENCTKISINMWVWNWTDTILSWFLAYIPYFEEIKAVLCDLPPVSVSTCLCVCLSVYPSPINFWMPEPIFMKLGMYIMAPEPISTTYFVNPSHQSVGLYAYSSVVARQRVGKHIPATTNTCNNVTIFDPSSSIRSALYKSRVCGSVCIYCYRS